MKSAAVHRDMTMALELDHVILPVSDSAEWFQFYTQVLACRVPTVPA